MEQQPIRVLQIGMTKNIGGLETYLMQQFDYLDKSKVMYDFVNITSENDIVFHDHIIENGGRVYGVRSRHSNPLRHYWQWIKLLHKIAGDYKAIVLNSNSLTYVFPIFIARFFNIPMRIMHSHNSGFEQKIGLAKKCIIAFNRVLLKFSATHYFACSQLAGKWMFGDNAKFTVIPNAINLKKYQFNPEIRASVRKSLDLENKFVVGHVGRFTYQKNHEFLIDIFAEIYKRNKEAVLLLVGGLAGDDTYLKKAKAKIQEYHLEDAVKFLGMRNDVPDLMQAMDCFVLPSHFEGLGIVCIEAQAAGLPTFLSDTIPIEAKLTSFCYYLSLKQDSSFWAENVLVNYGSRKNEVESLISHGYEIKSSTKKIEDFYIKVR